MWVLTLLVVVWDRRGGEGCKGDVDGGEVFIFCAKNTSYIQSACLCKYHRTGIPYLYRRGIDSEIQPPLPSQDSHNRTQQPRQPTSSRSGRCRARSPSTRGPDEEARAPASPRQAQGPLPSHPTAALAGTAHKAPSSVQQRTTSRTERIPTISPRSTTIKWRKPPRTIAAAASSNDQSGSAKTTSRVRWSATSSVSGLWPAPSEYSTSRSVMMPWPPASGSSTTAAPTWRSDISRAASRRLWPGPTVNTISLIPSRTCSRLTLQLECLQRLPQSSTPSAARQAPAFGAPATRPSDGPNH